MPTDNAVSSRPWIRRLRRAVLVLSLLLAAAAISAWAWGEQVASSIVRRKLHALVEDRLNARLQMGDLHYDYPLGVTVDAVSLTTTPASDEPAITLASFRKLHLQLAAIPLGSGPLLIERVVVSGPTLHLVRTPAGFGGDQALRRDDRPETTQSQPSRKLSEILRLRYVQLDDARIEYEDRRKPGTVPLVWEKINVRVDSHPSDQGTAVEFGFSAANADLAKIDARGRFDLDALELDLKQLAIETTVAPGQSQSALPAQFQRTLHRLGVAGSAKVSVAARLPLKDLGASEGEATLQITDAQAAPQGWPRGVDDLDATLSLKLANGVVTSRIGPVMARCGASALSLQPIDQFTLDLATRRWQASPIRGALAHAPFEPAPAPFLRQHITLVIKAALTQQDSPGGVELKFDDTTATLEGLGGKDVTLAGSIAYNGGKFALRPTTVTGLGGRVEMAGDYDTHAGFARGEMVVSNVDLAKFGGAFNPAAVRQPKGIITGDIRAGIAHGDPATLRSAGRFRITEGEFASVPVLGAIARSLKLGEGLFIASEAFGRLNIAEQAARFDRVAVSTAALRIRGQGEVRFDGKLNFSVYADSASNWQKNIKATKIPILSDLGGALAGGTQKVLGTVSKQFTHLRVGGTTAEPSVTPAPVPMLTENIAKLFIAED